MFRLYVTTVQKRVYPPGVKEDALMPRITITPLAPTEKRVGIGEGYGSYKGLWYLWTFRVDVWDRDPTQVETTSNEVFYSIWKHREYVPAVAANAAKGQFLLLEIKGGSPVTFNQGRQLYQRTINVAGLWLSKSAETW
jgi:hypothetical protein